jgi:hypothetical protein
MCSPIEIFRTYSGTWHRIHGTGNIKFLQNVAKPISDCTASHPTPHCYENLKSHKVDITCVRHHFQCCQHHLYLVCYWEWRGQYCVLREMYNVYNDGKLFTFVALDITENCGRLRINWRENYEITLKKYGVGDNVEIVVVKVSAVFCIWRVDHCKSDWKKRISPC